jgi:hypothetical protein
VKTRDGRDITINLTADAQVETTRKVSADEFKPGSYVGVTSVKGPDGNLVAKRVHALGPQVPQMHGAWDSIPDSTMTNSNITSIVKVGTATSLPSEQGRRAEDPRTAETEYFNFVPDARRPQEGRNDLHRGAHGGRVLTQRVMGE